MTKTIPSIYTLYISNRQASRQERTATQMNRAATAIYVTHNNLEKISRLHKIIQCLIVCQLFDFNVTLGIRGEGF